VVKNPPANAGDTRDAGSIPGLGRSLGERHGNPLQYFCPILKSLNGTSLVAQLVKNLPAILETWVRFLGWEDPLEEGMETNSHILVQRIPMDKGVSWATVHGGHKELNMTE